MFSNPFIRLRAVAALLGLGVQLEASHGATMDTYIRGLQQAPQSYGRKRLKLKHQRGGQSSPRPNSTTFFVDHGVQAAARRQRQFFRTGAR